MEPFELKAAMVVSFVRTCRGRTLAGTLVVMVAIGGKCDGFVSRRSCRVYGMLFKKSWKMEDGPSVA
jgi:hypothetical protein